MRDELHRLLKIIKMGIIIRLKVSQKAVESIIKRKHHNSSSESVSSNQLKSDSLLNVDKALEVNYPGTFDSASSKVSCNKARTTKPSGATAPSQRIKHNAFVRKIKKKLGI